MAKLSLTQKPTFTCDVKIPVPGDKPVPVTFTFKARKKDAMKAWIDSLNEDSKDIHNAAMECATGWDLDDEFNLENLKELEQNYAGSMRAVIATYIDEQTGARLGN